MGLNERESPKMNRDGCDEKVRGYIEDESVKFRRIKMGKVEN